MRYESLSILRGVAAMAVVLSHALRFCELQFGDAAPAKPPILEWLDFGAFGVVLFFVLSGFTLYANYGLVLRTGPQIGRFAVRRCFRIYPAYIVSMLAFLTINSAIHASVGFLDQHYIREFALPVTPVVILDHITLTHNFTGNLGHINNVYWSLPVEFQFYLLMPLFAAIMHRSSLALIASCGLMIVISAKAGLDWITPTLAWQFAGGMLVAWAIGQRKLPTDRLLWAAAFFFAVSIVAYARFGAGVPEHWSMQAMHYVDRAASYGLAAMLMVAACATLDRPARSSVERVGVWLGEISYSLYLYHNAAFLGCYAIVMAFGLGGWKIAAVVYLAGLPLSILLAWLSYTLVEKPSIDAGKRLTAARRPSSAVSTGKAPAA